MGLLSNSVSLMACPFAFQGYCGAQNDNQESKHPDKQAIRETHDKLFIRFLHIFSLRAAHTSCICHCKISGLIFRTPLGHVIISVVSDCLAWVIFSPVVLMKGLINYTQRGWSLAGRASISKLKQPLRHVWGAEKSVKGCLQLVIFHQETGRRSSDSGLLQQPPIWDLCFCPCPPVVYSTQRDHSKSVRYCHSQRLPTSSEQKWNSLHQTKAMHDLAWTLISTH